MKKIILITLVLACLAVLVGCMTGEAIRGPQGYPARDDLTYRPSYERPVQMVPTPTPAPTCCELHCETACGNADDPIIRNCLALSLHAATLVTLQHLSIPGQTALREADSLYP